MEPSKRFRAYLAGRGLPFTAARRAILEAVVSSRGHFDVDELRDRLRKRRVPLSAATVYRAMPLFVESGIVTETLRSGGRARYECAHAHHDHLECLRCGRVIEFADGELEKLQEEICRRHRFTPVEHSLGIRGYCSDCRGKAQA